MCTEYRIAEKNVQGRYYVDESCIYCELCLEIAPDNFSHDQDKGEAYISSQPTNNEQHTKVIEAIDMCPTKSIHDSITQPDDFMNTSSLSKSVLPTSLAHATAQMFAKLFRKR